MDRGFTGPQGSAAGGARRRLAGRLFDRQHSLQDPSFDPVSQRFGKEEVIVLFMLQSSIPNAMLNCTSQRFGKESVSSMSMLQLQLNSA